MAAITPNDVPSTPRRMPPSIPPREHPSGEHLSGQHPSDEHRPFGAPDEPRAARSAVPVLVSVGLLFGLAVAAAFVGRGIIDMLSSMLGQ